MLELFRCEFRRYALWSILVCVSAICLLFFLSKLKPLFEASTEQSALTSVIMFLGSFLFGFLQMFLHKRKNHWTFLIHRPLSPGRIYLSLMSSGAVCLVIALFVPWLTVTFIHDLFTGHVIDNRHYLYAFFALFTAFFAYLVGNLTAISSYKGSFTALIMLYLILDANPKTPFLQMLPIIILCAMFVYLNLVSFRVDLKKPLDNALPIVLITSVTSFAMIFLLLLSTTIFYHIPRFIAGNHPDNNPVAGSYHALWQFEQGEQAEYVLQNSDYGLKEQLVDQLELAEMEYLRIRPWNFMQPGQVYTRDVQYALEHNQTNSIWQFSHDSMLLEGREKLSSEPLGFLGKNGFVTKAEDIGEADRFTSVPFLVRDRFLVTSDAIYELNYEERSFLIKHQPGAGEYYVSGPQITDLFVYVVTNKQTYIFNRSVLLDEFQVAEAEYVIPHPASVYEIDFAKAYRMVDGYVMWYQGRFLNGYDQSGVHMTYARLDGQIEQIASREFTQYPHPPWIRHFDVMISPLLYLVQVQVYHFLEPEVKTSLYLPTSQVWRQMDKHGTSYVAIALNLISLLVAFILLHRQHNSLQVNISWYVMIGIIGLPALACLVLMTPWTWSNPLTFFRARHA